MPIASTPTHIELLGFYSTEATNSGMDLGQMAYGTKQKRFVYVKAGASNLVIGNVLQAPARDTNFTDMAVQAAVAITGASTVQLNPQFQGYPIPVTLGGTATTTTTQFKGGGLYITSGASQIGQTFEIMANDIQATTNGICNFYVRENPLVALTTSGKATVTLDSYNSVIQSPTTITGKTIGVAVTAIPATNFGWIQVSGECAVLSDATVATIGQGVQRSTSTAGAVTVATTNGADIGIASILGVSAEAQPVFLTLG